MSPHTHLRSLSWGIQLLTSMKRKEKEQREKENSVSGEGEEEQGEATEIG